ncbi:P-loop NTPase [Heliobacterium chlorum]|uniref:P-loop NTPase n=1 Tax=Heliobacterium chlorum TaxID=2698 RepID=A0ABR7T684_HELCL|nr:P-loop NTPase [Heliobacterium chlorum]MBC9786166.1 P-loop NTPase [Heliobacterium chlorum]
MNHPPKIIAVMSGKGGVGTSTITALLGAGLTKAGLLTGLLDADPVGPVIPVMFGVNQRMEQRGGKLHPSLSRDGLQIVSAGLLPEKLIDFSVEGPDKVIQAIISHGQWAPLDVLLIDMPAGFNDIHRFLFNELPVVGVVMVTSQRELDRLAIRNVMSILARRAVPILGVVENGGETECPSCSSLIRLSDREDLLAEDCEVVGCLPWTKKLAEFAREGRIEDYNHPLVFQMAVTVWENANKKD